MAGHYKFNPREEKVDEVELVTDADDLPQKLSQAGVSSSKIPCINTLILLVVLCLLVFLTALTLYNTVQGNSNSNSCESVDPTTAANSQQQVGGSLQINETHRVAQSIQQGMNYLLQLHQNTTSEIMVLLQQIFADQMAFHDNATDMMSMTQDHGEDTLAKVMNIIGTLSTHKDTSIASAAVVDDILILVKELLQLQNASILFNSVTPVSCQDIKTALPGSPSGYYHVNSRNIYCNMEELCGSKGGWTRLAFLDMGDSTESCPDGFQLFQSNGVRACGRTTPNSASCSPSLKFPTNGISYSEICGRVVGYQKGSPDAVYGYHDNIDAWYTDGISLTRGSPRQHVWTFICGTLENVFIVGNCPCNNPSPSQQQIPSFVGNDYFCESGDPDQQWYDVHTFFTDDALWDGKNCGSQEGPCCSVDGLPWFHRQYDNATTDYLELRVCGNQGTNDEDVPFSFYEIYVK